MPRRLTEDAVAQFWRDGFYFPLRAMPAERARDYRRLLERQEEKEGGPLQSNRRHKVHLLFRWANELIRMPTILDAIEDLIGPNILCWSSNFFIKEAATPAFVSWHQDATYWGLDPDDVVTAWIALSDAPIESGAMKFLPGSHRERVLPHVDTFHENNLLSRGQEIEVAVDDSKGVYVPLKAGEISLHHVKLVHGSAPNTTGDRRIGLAVRYIPPHVRQLKVRDSAMLVRGVDTHDYHDPEPEPLEDLSPASLAAHQDAMERQVKALYSGTEKQAFRA